MPATEKAAETGYHGLKEGAKHEEWTGMKADFHEEKDGRGEVLVIDGHPVMEQWEKPYMEKLAEVATSKGGKVLEVGFGLGLSASAIQRYNIEEHIIIEANANVIARGKEWAKKQPHKVTFLHGLWQDKVAELPENHLDGVLYDTYPLNKEEQHTHQFDFIKQIRNKIKPGGVLTYCNLTSIGVLKGQHAKWEDLWKKTQVPLIEKAGFPAYSYSTFKISAPSTCDYYAGHTEALVPKLETATGYHGLKEGAKHADWKKLAADYHEEKDGRGEVLFIDGHPVMEQWEKPYMEKLAQVASQRNGKVLEVGFGLGLSASAIQRNTIEEHIIIEANAAVIERGKEWAKSQPHKVTFMHGLWQDVVESLPDDHLDGVLYDTYPLNKEEQHTHQFDFISKIYRKIKPGGILTYCNLTSIGVLKGENKSWAKLWAKTQVPHIRSTGFRKFSFQTFKIQAPDTCDYYAGHTEALVPRLQRLADRKPIYKKVSQLRPEFRNLNTVVKVVSAPEKRTDAKEGEPVYKAVVGDTTGVVEIWVNEAQVGVMKKDVMVVVNNARVEQEKPNYIKVCLNEDAKVEVVTDRNFEDPVKTDNNISETEYVAPPVVEAKPQSSKGKGRKGKGKRGKGKGERKSSKDAKGEKKEAENPEAEKKKSRGKRGSRKGKGKKEAVEKKEENKSS